MNRILIVAVIALGFSHGAIGKSIEEELTNIINRDVQGNYSGKSCNVKLHIEQTKGYLLVSRISTIGHKSFCREIKSKAANIKKIQFPMRSSDKIQLKYVNFLFKYN